MAKALGYKNPNDAMSRHVDSDDKGVVKHDTLGGSQKTIIINESGLYALRCGTRGILLVLLLRGLKS